MAGKAKNMQEEFFMMHHRNMANKNGKEQVLNWS